MKTRALRILAVIVLGGLTALGAGNIPVNGFNALDSLLFGGSMVALLVATLLLAIYALKGTVTDDDFNTTMSTTVQQIQQKNDEES